MRTILVLSVVLVWLVGYTVAASATPSPPSPTVLCGRAQERHRRAEQMPDTVSLHEERQRELDESARLIERWC